MADPDHGNNEFPKGVLTPIQIGQYSNAFFGTLNNSNYCYQSQANQIIQEALKTVSTVQNIALDHLEKALEERVNIKHESTMFNEPIPEHVKQKLDQLKSQHDEEIKKANQALDQVQQVNRQATSSGEEASKVLEAFSEAVANNVLISMENALNAQKNAFATLMASTTQSLELIYSICSASISSKVARALEENGKKASANGVMNGVASKPKKELKKTK